MNNLKEKLDKVKDKVKSEKDSRLRERALKIWKSKPGKSKGGDEVIHGNGMPIERIAIPRANLLQLCLDNQFEGNKRKRIIILTLNRVVLM